MSFHDLKLTKGEKKLLSSIFRLRRIIEIPRPSEENSQDSILLLRCNVRDLEAIEYALKALEKIYSEAEAEEERRRKG